MKQPVMLQEWNIACAVPFRMFHEKPLALRCRMPSTAARVMAGPLKICSCTTYNLSDLVSGPVLSVQYGVWVHTFLLETSHSGISRSLYDTSALVDSTTFLSPS